MRCEDHLCAGWAKRLDRAASPPHRLWPHRLGCSLNPLLAGPFLIVGLPAPRIAQYIVGLLDVLERPALPLGVVGVPSLGHLPIGRFDLIHCRIRGDAEDQVVVFCHLTLFTRLQDGWTAGPAIAGTAIHRLFPLYELRHCMSSGLETDRKQRCRFCQSRSSMVNRDSPTNTDVAAPWYTASLHPRASVQG